MTFLQRLGKSSWMFWLDYFMVFLMLGLFISDYDFLWLIPCAIWIVVSVFDWHKDNVRLKESEQK